MKKAISSDGTVIAYDQIGQGPALILVGGAMGDRLFPGFIKLAELLATSFTVINYDRRGRGDSGDTDTYSVAGEVGDLKAVIDANGGAAYVWGMSSGAALALEAAASGLNITKLALYEPPFMVGDKARKLPADYEDQLKKLIAANRRDDALKLFLRNMGAPAIAVFIMRLMPFWPRLRAVANTLPYDVAVMGDFSLPSKRISSIIVPTLVIGGEKSQPVLRQAVQDVADLLPNGELLMLKGQSHNVSMKLLAPVLSNYFNL
jgi:pimeloyl-ACP methyl ester carboxylesterase